MADYSHISSVFDMLSNLNLSSLEIKRQVSSTIIFYNAINNLIEISPDELTPVVSNTRSHDQRFHHIYARITQYSNSFFPRSIRFWNTLPRGLIHQQSLQSFKNQMNITHQPLTPQSNRCNTCIHMQFSTHMCVILKLRLHIFLLSK